MISPDTIATVKERTDLVALIGENVRLTRAGRSWKGLCPFHKEKSPSFHVSPDRGFFHCFGCQESGSAVDFVMKVHGLDFREAITFLAERAGIPIEETNPEGRDRARGERQEKDELHAILHLASTFYEEQLGVAAPGVPTRGHPLAALARAELTRRGLPIEGDGEDAVRTRAAMAAFRIGYAPFGWDGLATFLRQQGASPVLAERAGLLVRRSSGSGHYDRFRHRLMFAVVDAMGRVVAFSGRALPEPTAEQLAHAGLQPMSASAPAEPPAKYVNSPESPVYTKGEHLFGLFQARQAVRQRGEAVLVEGNFDVFSLHARGVEHVVAPLGTAFTPVQARLLKRFAPRVIVLFDGDAAGRKATRAARQPCREGGLEAKVALLPQGQDPDDFVKSRGPAALEEVLKGATGMLEHLLAEALDSRAFGGATMSERVARVRAVAKLVGEEDDPSLRAMAKTFADRLAAQLVVDGRAPDDILQLERLVEQAFTTGARPAPAGARQEAPAPLTTPRDRSRPRWEAQPNSIVGALIDFPELLGDPEVAPALDLLEGDHALTAAALRQAIRGAEAGRHMGLDADEFLAHVPRSIHSFASGRLASPSFDAVATAKAVLLENAQLLRNLILDRANAADGEALRRGSPQDGDELAALRAVTERAKRKRGLE